MKSKKEIEYRLKSLRGELKRAGSPNSYRATYLKARIRELEWVSGLIEEIEL